MTLQYGPGKGAANTVTWAVGKRDSRFFCFDFRLSEWFVPISHSFRAGNAIV